MPRSCAARKTIGATRTAVAVLFITWLNAVVNKKTPANKASGPTEPNVLTNPFANNSAPPVTAKAVLIGIMAAIKTTLCQLIDRYDWLIDKQPPKTITTAAINVATTAGTIPVIIITIMPTKASNGNN